MTKDELLQRLTDIEWDDFECKAALDKMPEDVWETVFAFSNTSGGWVVFGIRQHGKQFELQGVNNGEKTESDFLTEVTFYLLDYDGTVPSLSPVEVPSSSPVVSSLVKVCPQFNSTQLEKAEKILEYLKSKNGSITDLMEVSGEKNKNRLRQKVLYPLIGAELIEPTIKETPNSPKQSYALTEKAKTLLI